MESALSIAIHNKNTILNTNVEKKTQEYTANVLKVELGESALTYKREMRKNFKRDKRIKVFHGTSFTNAVNIASSGFRVSHDFAGDGVFVKDNLKMAFAYAREHNNNGAVVKAELYLEHGEYSRRGNTIIVKEPLLLVPVKIYKLKIGVDSEEDPKPVLLRRQR